jgi:hypothetical protein
VVDAVDYHAD